MEKETADFKVKETDQCVRCDGTLKTKSLGGDSFGFLGTLGGGAFYCENTDCDLYGVLTLARKRKTEKVEAPKEEGNKN